LYTDSTLSVVCNGLNGCSNPITADGLGNFHYYRVSPIYAAGGPVTLQIYGSGLTMYTQPDQSIPASGSGPGPGYLPTAGAGLTLNLVAGTAYCGNPPVPVVYAGGTLTMTDEATNYVYLNPAATCAPAKNTTGFSTGQIPIATVVAAGGVITSVIDQRTWFLPQPCTMNSAGAVTCAAQGTNQNITLIPSGTGTVVGGGDNISVNGTAATDADFDNSTPAAPANALNVKWQKDALAPNNLSAYLPYTAPLTVTGGNLDCVDASGAGKGCLTAANWTKFNTRQLGYIAGSDTAAAVLADTDDQADIYVNRLGQGITISEVWCACDAGNPMIQLQKDDGAPADMLTANLACSAGAGASTTNFVAGESAVADGDRLDFKIVAAGGVAKRITVFAKYTLN
jgi:hypothetical protein